MNLYFVRDYSKLYQYGHAYVVEELVTFAARCDCNYSFHDGGGGRSPPHGEGGGGG